MRVYVGGESGLWGRVGLERWEGVSGQVSVGNGGRGGGLRIKMIELMGGGAGGGRKERTVYNIQTSGLTRRCGLGGDRARSERVERSPTPFLCSAPYIPLQLELQVCEAGLSSKSVQREV